MDKKVIKPIRPIEVEFYCPVRGMDMVVTITWRPSGNVYQIKFFKKGSSFPMETRTRTTPSDAIQAVADYVKIWVVDEDTST